MSWPPTSLISDPTATIGSAPSVLDIRSMLESADQAHHTDACRLVFGSHPPTKFFSIADLAGCAVGALGAGRFNVKSHT